MKKDMSHIKKADSESSNRVTAVKRGGGVHLAQPYALVVSCRGMRVWH